MNKSKRSQTKNLNVPIASTDDSQIILENSVDVSNKSSDENNDPFKERREFLVTKDDHHK